MSAFNPYAPPAADTLDSGRQWGESDDRGGLWRERFLLVMDKTATLPVDRCIVCDAPATGPPLRRKLSWHSPWWYLIVLVNLLFYAIAAMIVRKTVAVRVGLCDLHRTRRRRWIALAWSLILVALGLLGLVFSNPVTDFTMATLMALALCCSSLAVLSGSMAPGS